MHFTDDWNNEGRALEQKGNIETLGVYSQKNKGVWFYF